MSGREIVSRSLAFAGPERLPMALPAPWPCDIVEAAAPTPRDERECDWTQTAEGWRRTDEWGNTWARMNGFGMGEVVQGVAERDWAQLDDYRWPALSVPASSRSVQEAWGAAPDSYRLGSVGRLPMAIASKLRRLDQFLEDVLLERERVVALLDALAERLCRVVRSWAEAGADGVFVGEDWGTQDRLLIRPALWREVFEPGLARIFSTAHEVGLTVWLHSCGNIEDIIPDLIQIGVDVLQFDQPELYGLDRLAGRFGGRVSFWSPVDVQRRLQTRDEEAIRAGVRDMVARLGSYGGGFIAKRYPDDLSLGLEPHWQDVACDAFVAYGTGVEYRRSVGRQGSVAQ